MTILLLSLITADGTDNTLLFVGNAVILIVSLLLARTAVQMEPYFQPENNLPSSLEQWVFTLPVPTLILVYVTAVFNWAGLGFLLLLVTALSIIFIPTRQAKDEPQTSRLAHIISIFVPSILALAMPLLILLPAAQGLIILVVRVYSTAQSLPRE